jgi:hypothetical protein
MHPQNVPKEERSLPENRFGAQAPVSLFLNFLKSIKYFRKKYLPEANDKHYKSANFQYNILCI